jgi:predicted dehydrogenase
MAGKVRIGLIGTSNWVAEMYLPSLLSHPAAETVAVCGRNRERAAEIAAKLGGPRVFTDYQAMIAEAGLDAVLIVVPDDLHREMAVAAAEAGLHILCEKPLSNALDDAVAMAEAVAAAGVINMVLFTWRWQPHWRYLKHLVAAGYIGRCLRARLSFVEGIAFGKGYKWRFDGRRGTGTAGDLGSHMIDMAHWLLDDEVATVSASLKTFADQSAETIPPPLPSNDACFITMEMGRGAQVLVDVSSASYMADRDCRVAIEFHGDQGTIEAEHCFLGAEAGARLRGARKGEASFSTLVVPDEYYAGGVGRAATYDPYVRQPAGVRLFVDSILAGTPATPDFNDGLRVQRVLDAVLKSGKEGRVVSLT